MALDIVVPRINANEDEVLVAQISVGEGDRVAEGQLLFVVESTKAANEVLAPAAGIVGAIAVTAGTMLPVGAPLCRLVTDGGAVDAEAGPVKEAVGEIHVTLKARLRAAELGIDPAEVAAEDGRVTLAAIERHAAGLGRSRAAAVLLARPRGKAVIVGGGGHAATLYDAAMEAGWQVIGCTDRTLAPGSRVVGDLKVIGDDAVLDRLLADDVRTALIGIGGAVDNRLRAKLFDRLVAMGFDLPHLVHPRAHVGLGTVLGPGTVVLAGAVIGPRVRIGANVLVNQGVQLCHDSVVEDHAHLAPGAVIAGGCHIGAGATIGMAATILFGIRVGADCLVHNNVAVVGPLAANVELTRAGDHLERAR